jgi:uncharacterized protein DUF4337
MEHSPEHHIEEAEHAQHAARDPFDRRVTMSIAIVAAVLACITMLGHNAHNDTLRYQSEAAIIHSQESNKWNYFQAQKLRSHMYQANLEMLAEMLKALGKEQSSSDTVKRWEKQIAKYESRLPEEQKKAEDLDLEMKELQKKAHHAHLRGQRFDLGELGVELALVLCSIAVLTKKAQFWYFGLVSGLIGTLVALSGVLDLFMPGGH